MPAEHLRLFYVQYCNPASSRLVDMVDEVVLREAAQARSWLFQILDCHDQLFRREHEMQIFRSAIEKEMADRSDEWSPMEKLYMALTNCALPSPKERLDAAFALVLHFNFAESLKAVSERAVTFTTQFQRATIIDTEALEIHEKIFNKARSLEVDHFACATPLSEIKKIHASVIDDNAGCCPICQNSYTAMFDFSIVELMSDFPVRIKYCGHVVGKACLEQWMNTPKIEEAKYPHRTCPLCRVKIEDVEAPKMPARLLQHLKTNRRAIETLRELVYGWGLEPSECQDVVVRAMSEEIAIEQLLAEIAYQSLESGAHGCFEIEEEFLKAKMEDMDKVKWVWGFKGNGVWKELRDEWMNSGAMQKE